jgi:hypothetical protein
MPRPKDGYRNAAGQIVPGTHDPIKRFMQSGALIQWAYKRGKEGLALYDGKAVNIGTAVHMMAEMDLQGRSLEDIDYYAEQTLNGEQREVAVCCFAGFRAWREQFQVRPIAQEIPMVSERNQYGGTPDTIAVVGNGLGLLDFKTSAKGEVYPDMLLAMAAHGKLWLENHPDQPLTGGYHLIVLPKDGSPFKHFHYADLDAYWELFKLYLQAYRLDKVCSDSKALGGQTINVASSTAAPKLSKVTPKPQRKPPVQIPANERPLSMAEILRSYGHVKEGVTA